MAKPEREDSLRLIGSWAFILGVVIALLTGAFLPTPNATMTSFLVLLGTIVGILNVTQKEANSFLVSSVSLVLVSALGSNVVSATIHPVSAYLSSMLDAILIFVMPATIVVALKSIFSLAQR